MSVLALIPARSGSKGIPGKNFKPLVGTRAPVGLAYGVAVDAGCEVVFSSDYVDLIEAAPAMWPPALGVLRPAALAQDDTPMIDVVQHALGEIPGPEDQIILLVQPTQPMRQPKHLRAAIDLLRETQADSVVSVVELPRTHHPHWQGSVIGGQLVTWDRQAWSTVPSGRQALRPTYIRDGTVYAFWRKTVTTHGTIYGEDVRAMIIPPEETCPLDSPADWAEAERRLSVPAYDHDDAEADG